MAYLTLNSVTVDVEDGHSEVDEVVVGDQARAYDGTMRSTVRAWKRQWKLRATPLLLSDAEALKNLIRGQGDVWSLDSDAYSAKGTAISGSAPTITPGGKFGSYGDFESNGQTFPTLGSSYSILWWQLAQDGSGWRQYALVSSLGTYLAGAALNVGSIAAGLEMPAINIVASVPTVEVPVSSGPGHNYASPAAWAASHTYAANSYVTANGYVFMTAAGGTSGGSAPIWPTTYGATVTDNAITWQNVGPLAARLDDVVILPYAIPSSWLSQLASSTAAWGSSPRLAVAGGLVSASASAIGTVGATTNLQAQYGGAWSYLQCVEFTLDEV